MIIYIEVGGKLENVKHKEKVESETCSQASKNREEETEARLVRKTFLRKLE
jgi:hypothetical protein